MKPDGSANTTELRRRAETRLPAQHSPTAVPQSSAELQRLLHELQVQQIELEVQNEELRNSRAEVEKLNQRYADFYDFSPTSMVSLDRDSTIIQINLAGARLLESDRAGLIGKRFSEFVAQPDRLALRAFLQDVFEKGIRRIWGADLPRRDGRQALLRIEAMLSPDGQECRAVVVDITDTKKLEQELRKSTALLLQTQHMAGVGGWEYDVTTGRIAWTDEVFRIYEVSIDYDPNNIDQDVQFYSPEARASITSAFERLVELGEPYDLELPFVGARGTRKWVKTTGQAERVDGSVRRVFGDIMDVTERKLQRDLLEQQVGERTAQLHALAMELTMIEERERQEVAKELHDGLSQILAVAKLKLSALDPRLADSPWSGELKQKVTAIAGLLDEADRVARSLTMQLSPPVLHELGLVAALEWLADEMRSTYGLRVNVRDDGLPKLLDKAARTAVFRVTRELLINVAKHARIDVAELSTRCVADRLILSVVDAGAGFAAQGSLMPSAKGGFGLFSVRERIGFIGGEVHVDSSPGNGTVVVLSVPLMRSEGDQGK